MTLLDQFNAGGPVMFVLLALSVAALATAIERLINFREKTILCRDFAKKADVKWKAGKFDELRKSCDDNRSALAQIIGTVVSYRHQTFANINLVAGEIASSVMKGHLQRTYMLSIVATLGPLLGLFGTVVGMIEAFDVIAKSGAVGNAAMVAGGISKALTTTAAGLLVGIPALGLKHYFTSRIQKTAIELEEEVSQLINNWFLIEHSPNEN